MKIGDKVKVNIQEDSFKQLSHLGMSDYVIDHLFNDRIGKIVNMRCDPVATWAQIFFNNLGTYEMPISYLKCLTLQRTGHHLTDIFKN